MDKERAKEIAASPIMANVTYNGTQVYIENVNKNNRTANVHPLNEPTNRLDVYLTNLIEHE